MKFGFVGLGNMASAIIKGMTGSGKISGADIYGYDICQEQAQHLAQACGIQLCPQGAEVIAAADVLVLAVKPQVLPGVLPELAPLISNNKLVISIAAGKDIDFLQRYLGEEIPIIRVMPNINAKVAAATCCYSVNRKVLPEHEQTVCTIFSAIGSITKLPESQFSAFTAICGSAPAFTYLYIDALAKAAVAAGMPRQQALLLAADGVLGSAAMVLKSGEHPGALTDQVCSPGGTTIDGVLKLEEAGFTTAVHQAVAAVITKDQKLSGK